MPPDLDDFKNKEEESSVMPTAVSKLKEKPESSSIAPEQGQNSGQNLQNSLSKMNEKANEKEKPNMVKIIIVAVIGALILFVGFYIIASAMGLFSKPEEEPLPTVDLEKYYGPYKNIKDDNDYGYLYLRKDGTFRYDDSIKECDSPSIGTYKALGTDIVLTEKVQYGCGLCYTRENLRTIVISIKNSSTLLVTENIGDSTKVSEYVRSNTMREDENDKLRFSESPVENEKPFDGSEAWSICKASKQEEAEMKYVGAYISTRRSESGYLYLRSDGTFRYDASTRVCDDPIVGTYAVYKNEIFLLEKQHFGCSGCFSPIESKTIKAKIKEGGILTVEKYDYEKDETIIEEDADINRYVDNPENGKTPEGNTTAWRECDN